VTDDYDAFTEYVIRLLKGIQLRKNMSGLTQALSERVDHKDTAKKLDQIIQAYHGIRYYNCIKYLTRLGFLKTFILINRIYVHL